MPTFLYVGKNKFRDQIVSFATKSRIRNQKRSMLMNTSISQVGRRTLIYRHQIDFESEAPISYALCTNPSLLLSFVIHITEFSEKLL